MSDTLNFEVEPEAKEDTGGPPLCGTTCAPWTNYEKRKIAKLPEVK